MNPDQPEPRTWLLRLLKLWVWFSEVVRPGELEITLFWAGVIGFLGAVASVVFRSLTKSLQGLLTGEAGSAVAAFSHLPWWQCLLVPALGGALAGLSIYFGSQLKTRKSSTDYMEAIVLGDGVISLRLSLVKSLSALFSIASGASIGREGPLVQLSAVIASGVGRFRKMPTVRLRLLVACGAAAGIASAYNAPIAGALFVSEIVLRSVAMESFGPLVFSSVIATLTVRQLLGGDPLYEIAIPTVRLNSNWEIILYLMLGVLAGGIAPLFLWSLRYSERLFSKLSIPVYWRISVGGLIVGALAVFYPQVCGNGYSVVNALLHPGDPHYSGVIFAGKGFTLVSALLHGNYLWFIVAIIFLFKLLATAATFGSGAVGGVFTPTLFVGACVGYLFAAGSQVFWPGPALVPTAFTLVGMGALLAATTHAPIMAIIMLFELTLDYQIILPLMLACVVAHYVSRAFEPKSIYAESLKRKGSERIQEELSSLRVADLMKKDPVSVREDAPFVEIAQNFIRNRFNYLYVLDRNGSFAGAICLHDIKAYLNSPEIASLVIARDLVQERFPTITPDAPLAQALTQFSKLDGDRLPVVGDHGENRLIGSISKSDLILALAEQTKQDETSQGIR